MVKKIDADLAYQTLGNANVYRGKLKALVFYSERGEVQKKQQMLEEYG